MKKMTKINHTCYLKINVIHEIVLENFYNDNFIYRQFKKAASFSLLCKYALNDARHVLEAPVDCAFFHFHSIPSIINLEDSRILRKIPFKCFRPQTKSQLLYLRFLTFPRAFFEPTRKQAKFTLRVLAGPRLELLVNLCHGSFEGKEAATPSTLPPIFPVDFSSNGTVRSIKQLPGG